MFQSLRLNPLARLIAIILTGCLILALGGLGIWYLFKPDANKVNLPISDNLVDGLIGTNITSLDFKGAFRPELFYYNRINQDNWLLHIPSTVPNKAYIQPIIRQLGLPKESNQGYYAVIYNTKDKSYKLAKDFLGDRILGQKINTPIYDKDRSDTQIVKLFDLGKNWIYSLTDGSVFLSGVDFKDARVLVDEVYTDENRFAFNQLLDITSTEIVLLARKESIQSLYDKAAATRSPDNQSDQNRDNENLEFLDKTLYADTIIKLPIDKLIEANWRKELKGLSSLWTELPLAGAKAWQQKAKIDFETSLKEFRVAADINKLTPSVKSKSVSSGEIIRPPLPAEYYQDNYMRIDVLKSGRFFVHIGGAKNYFWLVDGITGQNINTEFNTPQSWDNTMTSACDTEKSYCKIVNLNDSLIYNLDASGSGGEYTFGSDKLVVKGLDIKSMEYTTRYRTQVLKESLSYYNGEFGFWQLGDWIKVN